MKSPSKQEMDRINAYWREQHEKTLFNTELTPIGEQYVVPGCERHERPKGSQLKLWEQPSVKQTER